MRRIDRLVLVFLFMAMTTAAAVAQRMMRLNADEAVIMREVGLIIGLEKGSLKVIMVPPKEGRPAGAPSVDAVEGDAVGMVNGKRVKTIKELRDAYEASKPGDEFKIGLIRDERPFIVTFVRKDEKEMPQGGRMMTMQRDEGDENQDFFPALGFGLKKEKDGVFVTETLPHAPKEIAKGDRVVSMNGTPVGNVADFAKGLDATKVGEEMKIELTRDGKASTVTMKRPEPRMRMIRN